MLDLTKFATVERLMVLAMLWSMPWASAQNMASVSGFTVASIDRHLEELGKQGLAFSFSMGRLTRLQRRWALSRLGIDMMRDKYDASDSFAISEEYLFRLAHRFDTVESAYSALPSVWADEKPRPAIQPGEPWHELEDPTLTFTHHSLSGNSRGDVVIFCHKAVLSGFNWTNSSFFDCLAEYFVPDHALTGTDLEHLKNTGRIRRITVPFVRHGLRPRNRELANGPTEGYQESERTMRRMHAGLEITSERDLSGHGLADYPPNAPVVVVLVDGRLSAVAALDRVYGHPSLILGDDGTRFQSGPFMCPQGSISVPNQAADYGQPEEVVKRLSADPMIPKENVQLFWRLFNDVVHWQGITEKELILRQGPSRATAIRQALAGMVKSGNIARFGEEFSLTDQGMRYLSRM